MEINKMIVVVVYGGLVSEVRKNNVNDDKCILFDYDNMEADGRDGHSEYEKFLKNHPDLKEINLTIFNKKKAPMINRGVEFL